MGGDAFPNTSRLSESDYIAVCGKISYIFNNIGINIKHGFPVEVLDKAELCAAMGKDRPFGDVDVIVAIGDEGKEGEVATKVRDELGGEENTIKNDKTISFLTKERFQVDLLFCNVDDLESVLAFKANNDFGALLGHLLTPFHLKWSTKGLSLKLKVEEVSGVGTTKEDLLLTNDTGKVCQFLGLDPTCLDGKTRMDTKQIYDRLTSCKVYFKDEYKEKYKIHQRRKKRPVSDRFFQLLESSTDELEKRKEEKFRGDVAHDILVRFRRKEITLETYRKRISACFDRSSELDNLLKKMSDNRKQCVDSKFDYNILITWYPDLNKNLLGKVFGKLKSKHSGDGVDVFQKWVEDEDLESIKVEVDDIIKKYLEQSRKHSNQKV